MSDEAKALEMLGILEVSWTVQIDTLGFSAPLDDGGECGPDGRYDVFIWRGIDGAFVDAIAENPLTPHDDYTTYMAISIAGSTGQGLLDTTLAHEFNHAAQASDDWWESALFFEMTATFVEALTYPQEDDYFFTLKDFQRRPEWSIFYVDNYATWHMYGAAMYLAFSERTILSQRSDVHRSTLARSPKHADWKSTGLHRRDPRGTPGRPRCHTGRNRH